MKIKQDIDVAVKIAYNAQEYLNQVYLYSLFMLHHKFKDKKQTILSNYSYKDYEIISENKLRINYIHSTPHGEMEDYFIVKIPTKTKK